MTLSEIPTVLTVKQFSEAIGMSESWVYSQWQHGGDNLPTLPKPFKIGRNTRVLGEEVVRFLKECAGHNNEATTCTTT